LLGALERAFRKRGTAILGSVQPQDATGEAGTVVVVVPVTKSSPEFLYARRRRAGPDPDHFWALITGLYDGTRVLLRSSFLCGLWS